MRAAALVGRAGLGAEAAVALTLATLAVRAFPNRVCTRLLGQPGPVGDPAVRRAPDRRARRIGRAVERVADLLPWKPRCLPQALATRAMLRWRRIPCEGHVGIVSRSPLRAHAWVTVDGRVVQGGPVRDLTEVAAFR